MSEDVTKIDSDTIQVDRNQRQIYTRAQLIKMKANANLEKDRVGSDVDRLEHYFTVMESE